MALEQGTVGSSPLNPGIPQDLFAQFSGRSVNGSDAIRVFSLDPAIVGADIEASLAKFDAQWNTSMTWNTTDRPVSSAIDQFQSAGGLQAIKQEQANFTTSLLKPLPTGGVAGITFNVPYTFTNLQARVNPAYTPSLQFQFEQPLLQGFGVEINELRASHPGSVLSALNVGGRVEGVLITRIRFDQQRAQFEQQVHQMLLNVETAYWNLYGSYWTLYSREAALRLGFESYKISRARFQAGTLSAASFAQTRGQYEIFRGQRLDALDQVLENERRLRMLVGLKIEDGARLVPADSPVLARFQPDWESAQREALALRPELVLARQDLKFRQLDLLNTKNLTLPDLRFTSTYDINGIGSRLDGPDGENAFRSLASNHFNDWTAGLQARVLLGYRDANAQARQAKLNLQRSYLQLRDMEDKAVDFLGLQSRLVVRSHNQISIQRSNREAQADQLRARFELYRLGKETLEFLLQAQQQWADALANEYGAIVAYNNALAAWEFSKGTIMTYDGVTIAEGPLPHCPAVRAVENAERRTHALVLRERANPVPYQPVCGDKVDGPVPVLPALPTDSAPSLPALMEKAPPMPPAEESSTPPVSPQARSLRHTTYPMAGTGVTPVGLSSPAGSPSSMPGGR
jgi:outer membrane protein TolC